MSNDELAKLYETLSMKYEEEFAVECGFAQATKERMAMLEKIRRGSLSKKDIRVIEPIFSYGNIDLSAYIQPRKRFVFF